MAEKIALTVDKGKKLSSFATSAYLKIVVKNNTIWRCEKTLPLALNVTNTNELRIKIHNIIDSIADCKILLSTEISGIPYYIFDKMGFSIFEATSQTSEILEEIITETKKNQNELATNSQISCTPIEITEGCYFLDYILLERNNPEITTKKALLPFLVKTPFISLTVRLAHLPAWLEASEYDPKMELTVKKDSGSLLVTMRHKICGER
jgi:hypothetical protein